MGIPADIFVEQPVDGHFLCPICHDVFDDPSCFTGCGHSFCTDCLQQYESSGGSSCPTCRHPASNATTTHGKNVTLNYVLQELQVKCDAGGHADGEREEDGDGGRIRRRMENGESVVVPRPDMTSYCGWTGKLQDWTKHREECPFVVEIMCPYCDWHGKQRLLNQHLLDNMDRHIKTTADERVKEANDKLKTHADKRVKEADDKLKTVARYLKTRADKRVKEAENKSNVKIRKLRDKLALARQALLCEEEGHLSDDGAYVREGEEEDDDLDDDSQSSEEDDSEEDSDEEDSVQGEEDGDDDADDHIDSASEEGTETDEDAGSDDDESGSNEEEEEVEDSYEDDGNRHWNALSLLRRFHSG